MVSSVGSISGLLAVSFVAQEGDEQDCAGREDGERPGGPAIGPTLDEWIDDCDQRQADDRDTAEIELDAGVRGTAGQRTGGEQQGQRADRNVDEEHQAPPGAPEVGVDERAGDDRRGEHRYARRRAEQTEGLVQLVVAEDLLHQAEALGDHERPEGALEHPEGDEHADARRRGAGGREEREPCRADEEQPAPAEDVSESCAGDQQNGKGQGVAGAQPLDGVGAAAEVAMDRGAGDVDDRGVEQIHDVGGQDDGRHDPAQAVGLRAVEVVMAAVSMRSSSRTEIEPFQDATYSVRYEHCTYRTPFLSK